MRDRRRMTWNQWAQGGPPPTPWWKQVNWWFITGMGSMFVLGIASWAALLLLVMGG